MQQRLGLAVALLGAPDLVILDEPTSALDPVGRADVRAIVRRARERGATVFLNSHLLTEVERVCDRVAIVDHGRVLASGRLDDLLGAARSSGSGRPDLAGRRRAGSAGSAASLRPTTTAGSRSTAPSTSAIPDVVAAIVAAGGRVHAVDPGRRSLEDRYFELITRRRGRRQPATRAASRAGLMAALVDRPA